jgi:Undecaprenyl-phosphate glucose phosphotransferase
VSLVRNAREKCSPPIARSRVSWLPALSYQSLSPLMASLDFVWTVSASIGAGVIYHITVVGNLGDYDRYFGSGIAVAALFCMSARACGLYQPSSFIRLETNVRRALTIWVLVFLCLATVAFTLKIGDLFSRGTVLLFFSSGGVGIVTLRIAIARALAYFIESGALGNRRVALLTSVECDPSQQNIEADLRRYGYAVTRVFNLCEGSGEAECSGPAAARVREILPYVRNRQVDEIVLAMPWGQAALIDQVANELRALPIPVRLMPDPIAGRFLECPILDLGPSKVIELQRAPLSVRQRAVKRTMDMALACLGLAALAPLFAAIAIAVRLSTQGPIFFVQVRVGFNGRRFRIYKFRTMTTLENGPVVQQVRREDPRVTRVGKFLRRYSLDELPQLLNVVRGEMSLVGPRPHALAHDNEYDALIASYATRQKMKPGVTGWAQVNGCRGETPELSMMQRRVAHDLHYIDCWSVWFDIRIVVITLVQMLKPRNVY